jgi:hypothetical protein
MERSQLFRLIQEKVDAEIGNKISGNVTLIVYLHEGGLTRCDCQVTQSLTLKRKEATMK